jgi:hypothetical protein
MKTRIGATVLKDKCILVLERKDSRDGQSILECDANLERFSKASYEIAKPALRLRWGQVAAAREKPKLTEGFK